MPTNSPLVSILIPTHNRPDLFEIALNSALSQTYGNIEIVVSDNGDNESTRDRIDPYIKEDSRIRYARIPACNSMKNFQNCFALSRGEFINYLLDDDQFHSEKIEKMVGYLIRIPTVGIVTSVRQLINIEGASMEAAPPFDKVFHTETLIEGRSLGKEMLTKPGSIIGEPTAALLRRSSLRNLFGVFCGIQYQVMADWATWLSILMQYDCIYLPEALSQLRIHDNQDSRQETTWIRANIEGLQMLCDAYADGYFLPENQQSCDALAAKLAQFVTRMSNFKGALQPNGIDVDFVEGLIQRASKAILKS
jgi:glycosyltransferase involved in cell wall biosynthesis